jgi:hypothetical protein
MTARQIHMKELADIDLPEQGLNHYDKLLDPEACSGIATS